MRELYLDNAATSWPKPPAVARAVREQLVRVGGNPGRSGHARSIAAGRAVLRCREALARLLSVDDPSRIVFTKNATEALNLVVQGLANAGALGAGSTVVTTGMEHNSVMRPLRAMAGRGVRVVQAPADSSGRVPAGEVARRITPDVRLVAVVHGSNVTGAVNDIAAVAGACRAQGVPLLVDAAQTAGCIPIDLRAIGVDYLAFSGHKGLLGPQGTGALYVRNEEGLPPLLRGGTGSLSDREEQPEFLPDRFESGTLNVPGIAGLAAGVAWLLDRGIDAVREHDRRLRAVLLDLVQGDPRVTAFGTDSAEYTGVLSVTFGNLSPSDAGERLERRHGILTRVGLHCAPGAHRSIGTFPHGTVRLSWGPFTSEREILRAGRALLAVAAGG